MIPQQESSTSRPSLQERVGPWIGPLFAVAVMAAAFWLVNKELKQHSWREIREKIADVPRAKMIWATVLTALNYLWLSGYDALALRYLGRRLKPTQILLGSFVGYAMSHNFGWIMGGTTSRFRLYSAWGLSAVEIVKLFAMLGLTFAMGFCGLGGLVFMTAPLPLPDDMKVFLSNWHLPITTTFGLGPICWGVLAIYFAACAYNRPISLRGWRIETPPLHLALMQVLVASGDLLFLSAAMYVLMPTEVTMSYWQFANVPLVAVGLGVASHVPGGLGVIEAVVLGMVRADKPALMGTLIAFRAIYYLLPLAVAISLLGG